MPEIETEFYAALREWKEHIYENRFMSFPNEFINCDAFHRIVALGPPALPFIRREYENPENEDHQNMRAPGVYWTFAIKQIVPSYGIKVEQKGSGAPVEKVAPGFVGVKPDLVREHTLRWLDDYLRENPEIS